MKDNRFHVKFALLVSLLIFIGCASHGLISEAQSTESTSQGTSAIEVTPMTVSVEPVPVEATQEVAETASVGEQVSSIEVSSEPAPPVEEVAKVPASEEVPAVESTQVAPAVEEAVETTVVESTPMMVVAQAEAVEATPVETAPVEEQPQETTPPAEEEPTPILDPSDPRSILYLDTSGKPAGLGDPNKPVSESYKIGRGWHPKALSASGLPRDKYGLVDWAKLVRENLIQPKHSLDPSEEEMPPLQMDVVIPAKGDFVNDVLFPHEMHTYWLKCEVCHPKIFVPAKGQNNMSMVGITEGKWCGRCHGKVAFPLTDCNRCHVIPKGESEAQAQ